MHKVRVGVLMGGKSIEREVSFNSGRTICDHLDTARYTICPIFQRQDGTLYLLPWHFLHRGKISDFEYRLEQEAQRLSWDALKNHVDIIYIAMHGRFSEDGTMQGMLEVLGIPYFGSKVLASALGMDKDAQKVMLRAHKIATPNSITIAPHEITMYEHNPQALIAHLAHNGISFPCITKPCLEGSSFGIRKVHTPSQLLDAVHYASTIYPDKQQKVIVEELIQGMEFSCIVITDYRTGNFIPLPPTEIVPEAHSIYDYDQKYMPGRACKCTPARCSAEDMRAIQETSIAVMHALDFKNLGRIDGFLTSDGRVLITDPNSFSGAAPSSYLFNQAAEIGMNHTRIINHLIQTELYAYGMLDAIQTEQTMTTSSQQKIRVAVLMAGDSDEREISLESGRNITYKLSPHKYQPIPIFVDDNMHLYTLTDAQLVRGSTKEIHSLLTQESRINWSDLPNITDFVFIGLHGGRGENGSVQGALEMLGLPYNGSSVLASALCMDKFKSAQFLAHKGFDVPHALLITNEAWNTQPDYVIQMITSSFTFPLIIKPHNDGCSVMVHKASTVDGIVTALNALFATGRHHAMIEEFVQGMELTVGVIGNDSPQALPPSKAVAAAGILSIQEKFLPGAGENITPAPLPQEALLFVQEVIAKAFAALGCKGYARIDCFYQDAAISPTGKQRVVILETNTLPGMTPATCIFHQAAEIGMRPMDFVDLIVTLGLEEHSKKKAAEIETRPAMSMEYKDVLGTH